MAGSEVIEQQLRDAEAALAAERSRCAEALDAHRRAEFRSASLFRQLGQTEDRLAEERDRLADARHQLAVERLRVEQLEERIAQLQKVIRDIHASTSWKLSYPIRWAKRLVRP